MVGNVIQLNEFDLTKLSMIPKNVKKDYIINYNGKKSKNLLLNYDNLLH
jgi:hypothetical protein